MSLEFKYQTLFTCSVPEGISLIKDFNEMVASDTPLDADALANIISLSFSNIKMSITELKLANDLNHCDVLLDGAAGPIRIVIRRRPSLVVDGQIYKLEDFDI